MRKNLILLLWLPFIHATAWIQIPELVNLDFLIGQWSGTGSGFGNNESTIESSFEYVKEGNYIEVYNESVFEPTTTNPDGDHHIDKGFISYDHAGRQVDFRQFNSEGYVNRYVLVDSLSTPTTLVFETKEIENFVPGGRARWTIKRSGEDQIETVFDVSFGEKGYTCLGTNMLTRK